MILTREERFEMVKKKVKNNVDEAIEKYDQKTNQEQRSNLKLRGLRKDLIIVSGKERGLISDHYKKQVFLAKPNE